MQKLLNDRRILIPVLLTAAVIAIGSVAIVVTADGTSSGGSSTASAPADSAQPAGAAVKVDIKDFKFKPPSVTVTAGSEVTFTNDDSALHTATLDGTFDTANLKQGDAKPVTFDEAGTYDYICDIHPFMKGTVFVK